MQIIENIVYGTEAPESQVLDLCLPEGEVSDLFIYFHGGGLEAGDKKGENGPLSYLVPVVEDGGKAVISANYRMYPKAVFPEFIEDAAAVVAWAKEHIHEYGDIKRIFVGGSSAGAYLTAMLAFAPKYLGAHHIQTTDIDGYLIDSAQMTTHFNVLRERGLDTRRILVDEAAPVYYLNETMCFPQILILVSDNDMACRYEQTMMFLKTLEMFGCPEDKMHFRLMQGYSHCGYLGSPEVFAGIVNEFIDQEKHVK